MDAQATDDRDDTLARIERSRRGEECYGCGATFGIVATSALGIKLFRCQSCGDSWFDLRDDADDADDAEREAGGE
jgi:hypothetical protein